MDIPKPEGWKNEIAVFDRVLTFDQSYSNDGAGGGFATWHDPADEVELKYHYLDLAPDAYGERVLVWDGRAPTNQEWAYQRARAGGWQVNPSGLPPGVLEQAPAWDVGPEKFPIVRSSASEKFASEMRDALKAMMEADPYYFDIPIITERLQNIDAKIEGIVAKAGGICIVLVTTTFEGPLVNLPGANFEVVRFTARTYENVKTNPTGKEAQHVAIYTAAFWSQLKPDTFDNPIKLDDPAVALGNDPRYLTYDTNAVTSGGTKIEIPRLEDLTIDASDLAAIALANPKPGAAIFYTLDHSFPAPRNPNAHLYLATFNAAPGVTVRARAYLAGYISSAELRQVL
jgi:hypothetical protein